MRNPITPLRHLCIVFSFFLGFAFSLSSQSLAQENDATRRLMKQSEKFDEQIIEVAENVHVAVGYSVSNVSMIVGEDGVVIVDTGMTGEAADRIAKGFREITDKPVKAIVYTHSHGDHTGGAPAFLGDELDGSPGETNDGLYVWYPAGKVLFAGDAFYQSFPNLYAIRGTPNRSVRKWGESLSKMAEHEAVALVGGHTNPILGASEVKQVLSDYRDAVQFIHDKTVEGINQGLTPDELVDSVQLPEPLASKDYQQPFYGHPQWGIRSVFNGFLGWFDGNASKLFPLPPKADALRVAKLAVGKDGLKAAAQNALAQDDNQWAAQLADHLLAINRDDSDAKQIKADALVKLAQGMVSVTPFMFG